MMQRIRSKGGRGRSSQTGFVWSLLFVSVGLVLIGLGVMAAETADVVVNYTVEEINAIDTNVESVTLVVTSGTAGVGLDPVRDNTTVTYSITSNALPGSKKITAHVGQRIPSHVGLNLSIEQPAPECTPSMVALSTSPKDVMTGVGSVSRTGLWMDIELWADVEAGVLSLRAVDLVLTIVDA